MTQGRYALYDPEDIPEDIQDEPLPSPPPGYEGGWLTPKQLRLRNKALEKVGLRICTKHQGAALPLDAAHFHAHPCGWRYVCKACKNRRTAERAKERYREDAAFREHRALLQRRDRRRHINARRSNNTRRMRVFRRRRKLARYAALLGSTP